MIVASFGRYSPSSGHDHEAAQSEGAFWHWAAAIAMVHRGDGPGAGPVLPERAKRAAGTHGTVNGVGSGDEGLAGVHDGEMAKADKDNVH